MYIITLYIYIYMYIYINEHDDKPVDNEHDNKPVTFGATQVPDFQTNPNEVGWETMGNPTIVDHFPIGKCMDFHI